MNLRLSTGNSKMGTIPSISLPAGITCRNDCDCNRKCYAKRLERIRKTVRESYKANHNLLLNEPETFWREIEASIMMSRFFRFHVSGDIPDDAYFANMVAISDRNKHCEILCFTKKFNIVNSYLNNSGVIPSNLHVVFSGWAGLDMDNPYNLPEAHVRYRDGTTTARDDAKECGGNCTECAITDDGCWTLKLGQQVVFNEH